MIPHFNLDSPNHISLLFFGGEVKTKERQLIGHYKNGKDKYKTIELLHKLQGLKLKPLKEWETKKDGFYKTDEEILNILSKRNDTDAGKIAQLMLQCRELQKQISTYYEGTEKCIFSTDNCVHGSFQHVQTDTGRLSSKNPNIQNQPRADESKVRQHFVSRFPDGQIIELDFGQLELVVQAELSKDHQYTQDILNGVDFHCKRLALKEQLDYNYVYNKIKYEKSQIWIDKRTQIKEFSFQRAYSAQAKSIAESLNLEVQIIQDLIDKENQEYPQLKQYKDQLVELVQKTAKPIAEMDKWGNILYKGNYKSITGRQYYFKAAKNRWRIPQIHNYMIQGTATADIVLMMVGKFWRDKAIHNRHKYFLINTVHDSIVLDCKKEYLEDAIEDLTLTFSQTCAIIKDTFKIDWEIPIGFEIKYGNSWYESGKN